MARTDLYYHGVNKTAYDCDTRIIYERKPTAYEHLKDNHYI